MSIPIPARTYGLWSQLPNSAPVNAAATPRILYINTIPITYINAIKNELLSLLSLSELLPKRETVTDIMGYTQGVRLSASPIKKMPANAQNRPRESKSASISPPPRADSASTMDPPDDSIPSKKSVLSG